MAELRNALSTRLQCALFCIGGMLGCFQTRSTAMGAESPSRNAPTESGLEQVAFEVEFPDPALATAPANMHRIIQFQEEGLPTGYALHFVTEVCADGQCKPVDVTMYWNVVGRYERLECPPDKPLTKKKHVPFEAGDYLALDSILQDRQSLVARHPVDFFVKPLPEPLPHEPLPEPLPHEPLPHEMVQGVDAVTSATPLAVQQAVVKDAAYTTWVMWHWANGRPAEEILRITKECRTPRLLKRLLRSSDQSCVEFAMDDVARHFSTSEQFTEDMLYVLEKGDRAQITKALRFLDGSVKDRQRLYARLIDSLYRMREAYVPMVIRHLAAEADLPDATLERLTVKLGELPYFPIHLILKLLEERGYSSRATKAHVLNLLDNSDFFIARRAYEHLTKQELDPESRDRVERFYEQYRDRL